MVNKLLNYALRSVTLPLYASIMIVSAANAQLIDGRTSQSVAPDQVIQNVEPGSILILGESHGLKNHQDQHVLLLNSLKNRGLAVSVGLEFINYPDQPFLDQYTGGQLAEADFLNIIGWQGFDFQFYKQQLLFPQQAGGFSIGLNIPRAITSKVVKVGLEGLTENEKNLLPPAFHVGRDSYKKRFMDIIHVPPGPVADRYFIAQSIWDDTMAYQATQFIHAHPQQVLVIIVGEFHAQYGGGLADRIRSRDSLVKITTVSQIWAVQKFADGHEENQSDEEIASEIQISPEEGPRGDFIWISKLDTVKKN